MEPLEIVVKEEESTAERTLNGVTTTYRKLNELSNEITSLRKEIVQATARSYAGALNSEKTDELYAAFPEAFKEGMAEFVPTGVMSFVNKSGVKTDTEYKSFDDYIRAFYPAFQKYGLFFEYFMEQNKDNDWVVICRLSHRKSEQWVQTWAAAKKPSGDSWGWKSEEADITKAKKRALRNILGL